MREEHKHEERKGLTVRTLVELLHPPLDTQKDKDKDRQRKDMADNDEVGQKDTSAHKRVCHEIAHDMQ